MRWLANYIREVFCAHEFLKEEKQKNYYKEGYVGNPQELERVEIWATLECKKCGYHKSYRKFQ